MKRHQNLWKTGLLNIVFQVMFLVVLFLFGRDVTLAARGLLQTAAGLVLVFVPCLIWTFFFYWQDRIEPEPTHYVIVALLVGMALASLFGLPLENRIFKVDAWIYTGGGATTLILGSIFVIGVISSFLFYLGIRYGFFPSKEFDEPVDGMVYGAFIGSGYAAVSSLAYLLAIRKMTLFAIGFTTTTNVLMYASTAALVGYFVGQAKFGKKPVQSYFIFGTLIGALLLGLYNILTSFIFSQGEESGFWLAFLLSLLLSVAVLVFVYTRMRVLTEHDLHRATKRGNIKADWWVYALFVVMIAVGVGTKMAAERGKTFFNEQYRLSFNYPTSFMPMLSNTKLKFGASALFDDVIFAYENPASVSKFKGQYTVTVKKEPLNLDVFEPSKYLGKVEPLSVVAKEKVEIGSVAGWRLKYAYLLKDESVERWRPKVILVVTDVIPVRDKTFVFALHSEDFEGDMQVYNTLLQSVQWKE